MNYKKIQTSLIKYKKEEVSVFLAYLKQLENDKDKQGQPKNKWYRYFTEDQAVDLYKKVALDDLFIDGDTITLTYKGRVMVNYNYQAYKNKLLNVYPEAMFDVQNVHQGDSFKFKKESGKVIYSHEIKDPFATQKTIIGCYCVIKTNRGEFIETLNMDDIKKMRNVAKTQAIWNAWESEMILKSVIKRACKRHFKDVTVNIERIDNENYEPETVAIEFSLKDQIEKCVTLEELETLYRDNKDNVEDEVVFIDLLSKRKIEIKSQS